MTETRTPKQIAADKIDMEMRRLSDRLISFGVHHGEFKITEAGRQLSSLRTRVRTHMHPRDREETV